MIDALKVLAALDSEDGRLRHGRQAGQCRKGCNPSHSRQMSV